MAPGWLLLALACPVSSADAGSPQGLQWEAISIRCRRTCRCTQKNCIVFVSLRIYGSAYTFIACCMCFADNIHLTLYVIYVRANRRWRLNMCISGVATFYWVGKSLCMTSYFWMICDMCALHSCTVHPLVTVYSILYY